MERGVEASIALSNWGRVGRSQGIGILLSLAMSSN